MPCLTAGGTEVLIDRERFEAGKAVVGQMDATQDQADKHVLILSNDYLDSRCCRHEMDRALRLDPQFARGAVIPVRLDDCSLPGKLQGPNAPLYVDLRDDRAPDPWRLLLGQCRADLVHDQASCCASGWRSGHR